MSFHIPDYSVYRCGKCGPKARCEECQAAALSHAGAWLGGLTAEADRKRRETKLFLIMVPCAVLLTLAVLTYCLWRAG